MWKLFSPIYYTQDEGSGASGSGEQNTDNSGGQGTTTTSIDWSKIDPNTIPETVLKANKAYTKVIDETINRRKELKTLKETLSKLQTGDEDEDKSTPQNAENKPDQGLTELEKQIKAITDRLLEQDTANLSTWRKMAGEQTGLKSDAVLKGLQGKSFDEVLAQAQGIAKDLGITPPPTQFGSVGSPIQQRDKSFMETVNRRMLGGDSVDPYDPNFHKAVGGGVVENNG